MNTPFGGPYINVDGLVHPSKNLIMLSGVCTLAGGQAYTTMRATGGSAGYQVTAGKTLYLVGGIVRGNINTGVALLYGDTDVGLNSSGSAPTNAAGVFAGADAALKSLIISLAGISGEKSMNLLGARVPAQKYPCVVNAANTTGTIFVQVFGYEQ